MALTFPPVRLMRDMSGVPGVTRAEGLISGLIRQMTLEEVDQGGRVLPPSRFLRRPDPSKGWGRARFIGVQVEDYLRHGNALSLVTARDERTGLPVAVMWLPAVSCSILDERHEGGPVTYFFNGLRLRTDDVVHVARTADPLNPARGIGVIEQHLSTWDRLGKQARYESDAYSQSGVPSVAVVTPNPDLSQEEADAAKESWMEKFARREPVILPTGTEVKTLAWSPTDSQMVEAHQMSLTDIASAFGMDGFWLGAPSEGLTYKNPASLYLGLVRETIEPISDDFEQQWGPEWLGMFSDLRFRKQDILTSTLTDEVGWITQAKGAGIIDADEGRDRLGYPPRKGDNER